MASSFPSPGEPAFIILPQRRTASDAAEQPKCENEASPPCFVASALPLGPESPTWEVQATPEAAEGACPATDNALQADRSAMNDILQELLADLVARSGVCASPKGAPSPAPPRTDVIAALAPPGAPPAVTAAPASLTCSVPDIVRHAARGDVATVRELLRRGDDPNCKDDFGLTALHGAAKKGHCQMVKLLLGWRAEVNARAVPLHGETPLHYAGKYGHTEVLRILVLQRADLQCATDEGHTPLQLAGLKGQSAAEAILKGEGLLGCHVPAIVRHAGRGEIDAVRRLLEEGEDPSHSDDFGLTALHSAAKKGDGEVVNLLLLWRANVNARATALHDETPLHYASKCGHTEVVFTLLARRADPRVVTDDGRTPLQHAAKKGHHAAREILMRAVEQ